MSNKILAAITTKIKKCSIHLKKNNNKIQKRKDLIKQNKLLYLNYFINIKFKTTKEDDTKIEINLKKTVNLNDNE